MNLNSMKEMYVEKATKYKLPSFKELNENFEIDKIDKESDTLLRSIRKVVMEKVLSSTAFLELLTNPANTPRIYYEYVKSMSVSDKQTIDKIYDVLRKLSLESLDLEISYNEKGEAELIKKINDSWNSLKSDFMKIMAGMKQEPTAVTKKEKSYFG